MTDLSQDNQLEDDDEHPTEGLMPSSIPSKKHFRDICNTSTVADSSNFPAKRLRTSATEGVDGGNEVIMCPNQSRGMNVNVEGASTQNQLAHPAKTHGHVLGKTARLRYTISELLSMKHDRRMRKLNVFPFSRHAADQVFQVSATEELVLDENGRLCTTDVLVEVASSENAPTFADMRLPNTVVKGLQIAGFERPSPVQHRGIPVARLGIDVIAQAKSGTGKTVVFTTVVTELALAAAPGRVCSVVLVPTREIARQVGQVVSNVLIGAREEASTRTEVAILVGGQPERLDVPRLKHATVAVGTPARVLALISKGIFDVTTVQLLVLDEADRLLDGGAGFDMGKVVSLLPSRRQSMAFSATYTPALVARLRALMRKPHLVWLGDRGVDDSGNTGNEMEMCRSAVLRGVRQWRINIEKEGERQKVLVRILKAREFNACIVFVGKREMAKDVAKKLRKVGLKCRHVTAALSNAQRREALGSFEKGKLKVLVCTDMLSRGVSFNVCDLVIQMDVPQEVSTYLHRVGRAGRFGGEGRSFVIVDNTQLNDVAGIEARIGRIEKWSENVNGKNAKDEKEVERVDKTRNKKQDSEEEKNLTESTRQKKQLETPIILVTSDEVGEIGLEDNVALGFADGYAAARKIIARIEAYRPTRCIDPQDDDRMED